MSVKSEAPTRISIEEGAANPKMAVRIPINRSNRTTATQADTTNFSIREREGRAAPSSGAELIIGLRR
jgi:hypothetical protein